MLSDHNGIELEINNRKSFEKSPSILKLSKTLGNNPWGKEEFKSKFKTHYKLNKMEIKHINFFGFALNQQLEGNL